jgi:hypothetical protein
MKNTRTVLILSLAATMAVASSTAWAGSKKTNLAAGKGETATPVSLAVETTNTAFSLVRYGDANKDVLSLITAARMLKDVGSRTSDAKRQGADATEKVAGGDKFAVESILERAKALAANRADLLALIEDVSKSGARGANAGPRRWGEVVSSRATDVYRVAFRGGEPAAVAVSGDGDSDLDLFVYDENDNLICKDEGRTDDMICRWNPKWTGDFIIKIRNLGVANRYRAVHN